MSCPRVARSSSVGTANSGVPMKIRRIQENLQCARSYRIQFAAARAISANMMRRLLILGQWLDALGLLCRLLEFLYHHIALELRYVIDEEHAIGMVDFVLQACGQQAVGLDLLGPEIGIEIFPFHRTG